MKKLKIDHFRRFFIFRYFSQNTLVLGVSLTASTSPEDGHAGNQQISGPSGPSKILLLLFLK